MSNTSPTHFLHYGLRRPVEGVTIRFPDGTGDRGVQPTMLVIWHESEGADYYDRTLAVQFFSGRNGRRFEGVLSFASPAAAARVLPWLADDLAKFARVVDGLLEAVTR